MIGIIGAMGIEIRALADLLEDKKSKTFSGVEYMSGKIYGKDVVLAVCGIGKVFAAICAQTMILKYNPDVIINTGVAGTLSDKLSIGDIAIADSVVQHDMDTSPLGDPVGLLSGINIVKIPADKDTVTKIESCVKETGANYEIGTIASGDQFLASNDVKTRIVKNFGAIAGEMEGGAIGHVCYVNNKPFCVLRAISDCADGSGAENYMEFLSHAAENATMIMARFIKEY
ncbi:MAG: 5'-methylthioadenosine/adenosylhomocysteine nucleosidase [Clostridia bacterium]|nr:5'-methylthioadenosine/adenosylhomocysteine nucleosidase [Clostridia bacterium]